MTTFLYSLFAFLIVLTLLITVHELGHFLVARWCGVKVKRFSIGFGKAVCTRVDRHGTEFVLALIPFGGYVRMLDEGDPQQKVTADERPYAFNRQSLWARTAIIVAGPLFNFLFAIAAFWLLFVIGISQVIPVVGEVAPQSIAANAGLQKGQEIYSLDGERMQSWNDVHRVLVTHIEEDEPLTIVVRDSQSEQLQTKSLQMLDWQVDNDVLQAVGIQPYLPPIQPSIGKIQPDQPADKAGFRAGDVIEAVDGDLIDDWRQFVRIVQASPQRTLNVSINRGTQRMDLSLTPDPIAEDGETKGFIGLQPLAFKWPDSLMRTERYGVVSALGHAIEETYTLSLATAETMLKIFTGQMSLRHISGPIGIAQGAGQSASVGLVYYLAFMALVSISLAVLNLLPIPMLDGGHLLFMLVEAIRGKPVSERAQLIAMSIGLGLLITLMLVAFYNDISRMILQLFH